MAGVFPYEGMERAWGLIAGTLVPHTLFLQLYRNDVTPDVDTVNGDLTQISDTGYSSITLSTGTWVINSTGDVTTLSYPQQTFSITVGTQTVYGFMVIDGTTNALVFVQRATTPIVLDPGGTDVKVTLTLNMTNA